MPQNCFGFKCYLALACLALAGCSADSRVKMDVDKFLNEVKGPEVGSIQETLTAQAEAAVKKGDYARAEMMYKQLLDQHSDDLVIRTSYADSLRRQGKNDAAIVQYNEIIKKDGKQAAALEGKGLCLMGKGEAQAASQLFEQVMAIDAHRWRTLNAIGILFAGRQMIDESLKYYQAALKESPSHPSILNNVGLTQALDKNYPAAEQALLSAQANLPSGSSDMKQVALNLALIYGLMGRMEDAERISAQYLTKSGLYNNLGLYAHLAKDDGLAKSYLNMALTSSASYYERAWNNLRNVSGSSPSSEE